MVSTIPRVRTKSQLVPAAIGKSVGNVAMADMILVVATGIFAFAAIVEATPKSPKDSAKTMVAPAKMAGSRMGVTILMVRGIDPPWIRDASSKRRPKPRIAGEMAKYAKGTPVKVRIIIIPPVPRTKLRIEPFTRPSCEKILPGATTSFQPTEVTYVGTRRITHSKPGIQRDSRKFTR
jgi:hypothetical protein